VRATLRGIKRKQACIQQQAKPLLRDDLLFVLDAMGNQLKDMRDRALLLIGFAAALRRSELVALDVADVEHVRRGVVLHLRRSKTDHDGRGHKVAIPYGRSRWCPVALLDAWLSVRVSQTARYSGQWTATVASVTCGYREKPFQS
jgi:site-specific recombinase XerC